MSDARESSATRLVLLGAPGAGKGTQASLLEQRLDLCALSTGDLLRGLQEASGSRLSEAEREALDHMRRGELVPDGTVVALVAEQVDCLHHPRGFLLDGFPRTLAQARALDELLRVGGLGLDAVLSYELPLEAIVARLGGRRTCFACRAIYHVETRPPRRSGVCDRCGGALGQRDDDRPEAVRTRMQTYERETAPLATYYQEQGLLCPVPAHGTPEEIFERSLVRLEALRGARSSSVGD